MTVLLRVEQLLGFFKRFVEQKMHITLRLFDQAKMYINYRDNFSSSKVEVLEFIQFHNEVA